jgi:hypothetical protein
VLAVVVVPVTVDTGVVLTVVPAQRQQQPFRSVDKHTVGEAYW